MAANEFGWRILDPRHLAPYAAPDFVDAPAITGQPGETGFDQHDPEGGKLLKYPLGDQAEKLLFKGRRVGGIFLDEVGGPTGI
jgi:hypothetical protein